MIRRSRGKKFESELYQMLKHHPAITHFRHCPDTGRHLNPIDFLCYQAGGHGLVIEAKAIKGKSLSFSRFVSEKERTYGEKYGRQWRTLEKCANAGVDTFVFVNHYGWPGRDGLRGRAWAVPFLAMVDYRANTVRKSWPLTFLKEFDELRKVAEAWEWEQLGLMR